MYTLKETAIYSKMVNALFTQDEQEQLHIFIAQNHDNGDVIPHSGGCRKIRYARTGMGKRGGVRVIYYNQLDDGVINLLLVYAKAKTQNIPSHILKQITKELNKGVQP
ncbi:transcriptional regulator [Moraxella nasovis]|uniref:transcriptional regulator n=1 Tax=Moraxella nasovis TaxID=2904121 RepID=UPI001F61E5C3|nr:transcriptional regulator [Moraxella nasovis]UNU72943.1 transcriptional regulator [Moraxella nasovis]